MRFFRLISSKVSFRKKLNSIKKSELFDAEWYVDKYGNLGEYEGVPAKHYLKLGWKKGYDPSEYFVTNEYLELHSDVRESKICPLLHYERNGKYEGRRYRINPEDEVIQFKPSGLKLFLWRIYRKKQNIRKIIYYKKMKIVPNKILFKTFQLKYTCNPKFICEEILRQKLNYDVVWLYKGDESVIQDFPKEIRLVKDNTKNALQEIATAKVLIDNGSLFFSGVVGKKRKQVSICTWHGSLGFKKLVVKKMPNGKPIRTIQMYQDTHDYLLSNSDFENRVYRDSYWTKSVLLKYGHPRNDILLSRDESRMRAIKEKVCSKLKIDHAKKIMLYAPTFRESMIHNATSYMPALIKEKGCYDFDVDRVVKALEKRFSGEWIVAVRQHFVNSKNSMLRIAESNYMVDATDYPDIQELMVAADAGVTDYSSWILDYILTGKPGFIYAVDAEDYELTRGMYYPLKESPFSVAMSMEELIQKIAEFDAENYGNEVRRFLDKMGCVEDGNASSRAVDFIKKITNYS